MNTLDILRDCYQFNRSRTLKVLDTVELEPDPLQVLGWRPGDDRAHIAWQLVHIGVTEEIFATERLAPDKPRAFEEFWPRFRGGSIPDNEIPEPARIREILTSSREQFLDTVSRFQEANLDEVSTPFTDRGWTLRDVLNVINWHEAHHQGQAHISLNLYKASIS